MQKGSPARRAAFVMLMVAIALFNVSLDIGFLSVGMFSATYFVAPFKSGQSVPGSAFASLESVAMTGNGSGWAVGWGFGSSSVIMRADAGRWTILPRPAGLDGGEMLFAVAMDSPQDGWMIADPPYPAPGETDSSAGTVLLRYQNGQWRVASPPLPGELDGLALRTASDGWVVGLNTILHWNGAQWAPTPLPADATAVSSAALNAVAAPSAKEAWAVGMNGVMLRWDGAKWRSVDLWDEILAHAAQPVSASLLEPNITSVVMTAPGEGWAVGTGKDQQARPSGEILQCHAGQWRLAQVLPGVLPDALALSSQSDGWMVGNDGAILRLRNDQWRQVTSPTSNDLRSVSITPDGQAWAVGYGGSVLHEQNGAWSVVSHIDWSKASSQRAS